jgi:arginyl-tRNA--protein-N-Asp/Glu arginylyltransferase
MFGRAAFTGAPASGGGSGRLKASETASNCPIVEKRRWWQDGHGRLRSQMKLLFSEHSPDYATYSFPYAVWAVPERDETPADIFNAGFLPSGHSLERFYLGRQIRVALERFELSSENRRILRKGAGLNVDLVPRAKFVYTPERRQFFKSYADATFGADVMTLDRLDSLFDSPVCSHLLVFSDTQTGAEAGVAVLYLEGPALAYYYYAFYDRGHPVRSLGMFMMTSAAELFAGRGCRHLYLGTCYSDSALYKTQFAGAEFFNGFHWSQNLAELKYLVQRGQKPVRGHVLETEEYRAAFFPGGLAEMAAASAFRVDREKAKSTGQTPESREH